MLSALSLFGRFKRDDADFAVGLVENLLHRPCALS